MASVQIDERLKDYATPRQWEKIKAYAEHGSFRQAGLALGISQGNIHDAFRIVTQRAELARRQAAIAPRGTAGFVAREVTTHYDGSDNLTGSTLKEGPEPQDFGGIGEGPERDGHGAYMVKGVSTYYGAGGEQRGQWIKTKVDEETRLRGIEASIAKLATDSLPRLEPIASPAHTLADLLNLYVFSDYHLGMRAWAEEGGADWDLAIAEDMITRCFEHMVASAPPARVGFIAVLGDFLHFDGLLPVTPTSRHILDAAAHYEAIVDAAIRVVRRLIDFALHRHGEVVVLAAEGNHDIAGSMWLRPVLRTLYEGEPRVTVVRGAKPYYAYEFGKTMLAFHHGHLKKKDELPVLFADQFDEMWGRTKKRYAHSGHYHHEVVVKEESGMRVIQHPTLAPNDSNSARGGYSPNGRQALTVSYHCEFGRVGDAVVTPEMLSRPVG